MNHPLYALVAEKTAALREKLVATRRDFYMHPELSGEEGRTARVIAARLRALGLAVETGVGGYGVVGLLHGASPGPVVAYRADMDALPVQDTLEMPYRSAVLGVKHACGHDLHVTIALGVAEVLAALRENVTGTVQFIFQPAEESLDGAQAMLADGVLDDPTPDVIFALHAFPLPVGQVGLAAGPCLAGMQEFRVRFEGSPSDLEALAERAGAALQALSTGEPPTTSEAYDALIHVMCAGDVPAETVYVSCWPVAGETSTGHYLLGLVSVPQFAMLDAVRERIRRTLDEVTAGAAYDFAFTFSNPPLVNDRTVVASIAPVVANVVGDEHVVHFHAPYPFAHEDFSLYLAQVPGALLWLGTANPNKGLASIPHTSDFDVDEGALDVGVRVMTAVLLHALDG